VIDPIVLRMPLFLLGLKSYDGALRFDSSKTTRVILVPRDGGKPRVAECEPFFHFHVNNAFEDGGDTVVDLVRYEDYALGESLRNFKTGSFDQRGTLWRMRVSPSGDVTNEEICPWTCEFPQHDWRLTTRSHRFAYTSATRNGGLIGQAIVKVDHDTATWTAHEFPEGKIAGEPIFVPRAKDSAEDDGWLLSLVYSPGEHRSELVVLDARDVESDPIAVARLRHHVPLGFHGTFTRRVAAPQARMGLSPKRIAA
jgi:all-trans-8'-apo-beta-carotenal 15,15'-oxygenase